MNDYMVYRHTAPNGKMYVGITKLKPEHRWNEGRGYYKQPKFFNAINKYGWDNFKHEILLDNLTIEQAELAEKLFIGYWSLTNQECGYNIDGGGKLNKYVSDETRKKMSIAHSGCNNHMYGRHHTKDTRDKISKANKGKHEGKNNPRYGKKHTKEAILKMSVANKGKTISQETRKKLSISLGKQVVAMDKNNGKIISVYNSTREAERQTEIPHTNISECCRGIRKTAGGYKWKYKEYTEK